MPQGGLDFGAALNPEAVIQQNQQFDFYDGGGLDLACLGMAQADRPATSMSAASAASWPAPAASSTSRRTPRSWCLPAPSRPAGSRSPSRTGASRSRREGKSPKFIEKVEQITFSGDYAAETGQPVIYVTERCVFRRTKSPAWSSIEVAPGIDIERDILAHMGFKPIVNDPKPMDPRIFSPETMGLEQMFLRPDLAERISYDQPRNTLFLNLRASRSAPSTTSTSSGARWRRGAAQSAARLRSSSTMTGSISIPWSATPTSP